MTVARPTVGVVGCFQNGKSTLVNCLLDDKVAMIGDGRATTRLSTVFAWGEVQEAFAVCSDNTRHAIPFHDYIEGKGIPDVGMAHFEVNLWKPLLQHVRVIDTPGFEDSDEDNETARNSLTDVDFLIFVARNKALSQAEQHILKMVAEQNIPFAVLINCTSVSHGLWEPLSPANNRICEQIESSLKAVGNAPYPIHGRYIWPVNLAWFWYATQHMHGEGLSEAEEDLFDDVQRFMSKKLGLSNYDHAELAEKSNFIPFRETVQRIATHHGYTHSESGKKARRWVKSAQEHLEENDLDNAMIAAERACYTAPNYTPALHCRASVCFEREEFDEVIHSTGRVLSIDARDVDSLFLRAKSQFQKNEFDMAKDDLVCIAELIESEWHIVWDESDKTVKAEKLLDAYLMKAECEKRSDNANIAFETLRHIIKSEQNPLDNLSNLQIRLCVWILSAGLEYHEGNYSTSIASASAALEALENNNNKMPDSCCRLAGLLALFNLNTGDVAITTTNCRDELQRLLWKALLLQSEGWNIEESVAQFCCRTKSPVSMNVWCDEPDFVPYFISYSGREGGSGDTASYVEQYFEHTSDQALDEFVRKAAIGLNGNAKADLDAAVALKSHIEVNSMLAMNSIVIKNEGYTVLSAVQLQVGYKANDVQKSKTLQLDELLSKGDSHKWADVFEGKSALGVDWFGGNKITDIKIQSVHAKQGIVEVVAIAIN